MMTSSDIIIENGIRYTYCSENELRAGTGVNNTSTQNALIDEFANITSLHIPGSVQGKKVVEIGTYAFFECYSIVYVHIDEPVERVLFRAFDRLISLTEIHFPQTIKTLEKWSVSGYNEDAEIKITKGTINVFFNGTTQLTNVVANSILNKEIIQLFFCTRPNINPSTGFVISYSKFRVYGPFLGKLSNISVRRSSHHCLIGEYDIICTRINFFNPLYCVLSFIIILL